MTPPGPQHLRNMSAKVILTGLDLAIVRAVVHAHGTYGAARRLGTNPAAVGTAVSGGPVLRSTATRLLERARALGEAS